MAMLRLWAGMAKGFPALCDHEKGLAYRVPTSPFQAARSGRSNDAGTQSSYALACSDKTGDSRGGATEALRHDFDRLKEFPENLPNESHAWPERRAAVGRVLLASTQQERLIGKAG